MSDKTQEQTDCIIDLNDATEQLQLICATDGLQVRGSYFNEHIYWNDCWQPFVHTDSAVDLSNYIKADYCPGFLRKHSCEIWRHRIVMGLSFPMSLSFAGFLILTRIINHRGIIRYCRKIDAKYVSMPINRVCDEHYILNSHLALCMCTVCTESNNCYRCHYWAREMLSRLDVQPLLSSTRLEDECKWATAQSVWVIYSFYDCRAVTSLNIDAM